MANNAEEKPPAGYHWVYTKWITRKGVRVYPPSGRKVWRFLAKDK